jgi:hypothetical protein
MFDSKGFVQNIRLRYFDITELHTFNKEGCAFIEHLEATNNISLFRLLSVRIIIRYKWNRIKKVIIYLQFLPHTALLFAHILWNAQVRENRDTNPRTNALISII